VIFSLLWATLVYDPVAHWVWGAGGWLRSLGALDFAGGTVVHITSGVSALVAAVMLGRRLGFGEEPLDHHDATMTVLGAALLWFGWFGFNAGSALVSGGLAVNAFVVTNTAAAMGALSWLTVSWLRQKRPSAIGAAAGAVAGLVAITPAAGFVDAKAAIIIGAGAGTLCYLAAQLKHRLRVDDSLDVWAVHGVGGWWGALATGLFATTTVNSAGVNGLFFGNPAQLGIQAIAVAVVSLYAAGATWAILKLVNWFVGLRVPAADEARGLDASQHGERAYQF
jgi:Amt family ammonium transporter